MISYCNDLLALENKKTQDQIYDILEYENIHLRVLTNKPTNK